MSERRKRNIVICTLCGVLLLMTVGYAAFNTLLTINGTTSISSNWDIRITGITSEDIVGGASDAESSVVDNLTANFKANLVSPGDSITYYVTVENKGNINAELAGIKMSKNDNSAITFETSGLTTGDALNAGDKAVLKIKVTYNSNITKQPDNLEANLTVTLNYVQEGHKSEWKPEGSKTIEELKELVTTEGDGLYEDTYEPGRYIYRGAAPDNYITFNNEQWRIIAVETDDTLKIVRAITLEERPFDSQNARTDGYCSYAYRDGEHLGCNVWAITDNYDNHSSSTGGTKGPVTKDSEIKTYLNTTYYNSIVANKEAIEYHNFYYGSVYDKAENETEVVNEEKKYATKSYIGLINTSDFLKTNTNTEYCGKNPHNPWANFASNNCVSTGWMHRVSITGSWSYTLNPNFSNGYTVTSGAVQTFRMNGYFQPQYPKNVYSIVPALYLKSDILLSGDGTQENPYTIENY